MIDKPYVLFSPIPIYRTQSGQWYCDRLWAKDLRLHFDYISDFSLCCGVELSDNVEGLDEITDYPIRRIHALKTMHSVAAAMVGMVPNFFSIIKACRDAKIIHSGGVGWPLPSSFVILLLRPFFNFQWIIILESSDWMLDERFEKGSARKRFSHWLHRVGLGLCVKMADARIFTQSFYRRYFLADQVDRTLVAPAVWFDGRDLKTVAAVRQRLCNRDSCSLRLIFPSRLNKEKGVYVLFEAVDILRDRGVPLSITIMGDGTLAAECRRLALTAHGSVELLFREPVCYGEAFLEVVAEHDAVLVLNLREEQPRIIFDAFSQGVPVIASDTTGITDVTVGGTNAILFKRGDPSGLADAIGYAVQNPGTLREMGLNALAYVRHKTHRQMHVDREKFLLQVLHS